MVSDFENKRTYSKYYVKPGDTLETIASKNNLDYELIYHYNQLNNSNITIIK